MIVMMIVMPRLLLMKVYKHSNHDWSDSYLINFIAGVVKILSDTAMPSTRHTTGRQAIPVPSYSITTRFPRLSQEHSD